MGNTETTELTVCGVYRSFRSLPPYGQPILVLRVNKSDSFLHIRIIPNEADAISIAFHNLSSPKPSLHDIIVNIITKISNLTVKCAMILEIEQARSILSEDYHLLTCLILLSNDGTKRHALGCDIGDALAIAMRSKAPIFIRKELLGMLVGNMYPIEESIGGLVEKEFRWCPNCHKSDRVHFLYGTRQFCENCGDFSGNEPA